MTKMEKDVLHPFYPIFYCRDIDNICNRYKIKKQDDLDEAS